ncbi:hypothetical protein B566_EDAN005872 [Ephemera danica]|nr:hypothetical protein B566_EDAN005872 [Ephemera danica]
MSAGGYYSIEQKVRKLRLVALNTNLYARKGGNRLQALHPEAAASSSLGGDDDPGGQWAWLEAVLDKCMRSRETVSIVVVTVPILARNFISTQLKTLPEQKKNPTLTPRRNIPLCYLDEPAD